MKVALIQFKPAENCDENLEHSIELIEKAEPVDLIVLPECFLSPFGSEFTLDQDEVLEIFSNLAKEKNCIIVVGTIPEKTDEGNYNTSFVFGRDGKLLGKHRKIHMYDAKLPGVVTNESGKYLSGKTPTLIDTDLGKLGLLVCFDLRFPELFVDLAKKGAHTVIVPAAFSKKTGEKHWELLLRARALDSQCYILGCGCAETEDSKFNTYGHSIAVNPYGDVEARALGDEEILYYIYFPEDVEKYREMLPVLKQYA